MFFKKNKKVYLEQADQQEYESLKAEYKALFYDYNLLRVTNDRLLKELKTQEGMFDFSPLWADQEQTKLNIVGIISIILSFIILIVILFIKK